VLYQTELRTYNAEHSIEAQGTSDHHRHHFRDKDEDASLLQLFANYDHIILNAPKDTTIVPGRTVRKSPAQISTFHAARDVIKGPFGADGLGWAAVETTGSEALALRLNM